MLVGDALCEIDPTLGPKEGLLDGCVKLLSLLLVSSLLPKHQMTGAADLIY